MPGCETSPVESTRPVPRPVGDTDDARRAIERCDVLLSERGEVSGARLATEALAAYQSLTGSSLDAFFDLLASRFSPDPDIVRSSGEAYRKDPSHANLVELQRAVESPRQELFRRLNLASGGTEALIDMRRRLLRGLDVHRAWSASEADLAHLLRSWFNGGFLEVRRIDLRSPPAVLGNLIQYESVHAIRDWRELRGKRLVDPACFVS